MAYRFSPMSISYEVVRTRLGLPRSGNYLMCWQCARSWALLHTKEDKTPGSHPVAVISYGCWQKRFASDHGIIACAHTERPRLYSNRVAPRDLTD